MMEFDEITRRDALRYLGIFESPVKPENGGEGAFEESKRKILEIAAECEKEIAAMARPGYVYKKFRIEDCPLPFLNGELGQDIRAHLAGCEFVVLQATTLGLEVDRLIRKAEITDMTKAVVMDALASAASEQVCREADLLLHRKSPGLWQTFRFSPGYGDFPLSVQARLLSLLDAGKRIGLASSDSSLLTPRKSVTGVIGLSAQKPDADRLSDIYLLIADYQPADYQPAASQSADYQPAACQSEETGPASEDGVPAARTSGHAAGHKCSRCSMAATCKYRR